MTQDEIAKVVAGLTDDQRQELLRGSFSGDGPMSVARALIAKGLMHLRIDSPNKLWGFIECTGKGEAVRAHILGQGREE